MRINWLSYWAAAHLLTDRSARWPARRSSIAMPADLDADRRRIQIELNAIRARCTESA